MALVLKEQEIPLDDPQSICMFQPSPAKPFVATPAAIHMHGEQTIIRCLKLLHFKAELHGGIDYLQVFESDDSDNLWFIEDGEGGAITALLPSDY